MTVFSLLAVSFILNIVAVVWFICAVVLILVILIQKGKGGGLSGALGGMGSAGGILGSKTGDFLTWFTIAVVGVFLAFSVVLAKYYKPSVSDSDLSPAVRQAQPISSPQPVPIDQESVEVGGGAEEDIDINAITN